MFGVETKTAGGFSGFSGFKQYQIQSLNLRACSNGNHTFSTTIIFIEIDNDFIFIEF